MPTPRNRAFARPGAWWRENRDSFGVLWTAFVLVHGVLSLLALVGTGLPLGDVSIVYKGWMQTAVDGGAIAGIDTGWVYPILAWAPIAASWLFGAAGYDVTWLCIVALLDAAAFALLLHGRSALRLAVARWWLLFLVLLGPIAVGRIDAITAPPAIAGMLWAATRPAVAALLLTVATWIKVWPAAILGAAVLLLRQRVHHVLVPLAVSALIVLAVVIAGGGDHVFSFVTDQTTRGLQIEAIISTPWMWLSMDGSSGSYVWYAADINTYEMHGPGTEVAAELMTPLLALSMVAVTLLGVRALRAGTAPARIFPLLTAAFVVVFIDVNKVLSPQYIVWLAPPIIAGLIATRDGSFTVPARLTLVIAALTQLVYPYLYRDLLLSSWWMVLVLTARNVLLLVLLGWLVRELWRAGRRSAEGPGGRLREPVATGAPSASAS